MSNHKQNTNSVGFLTKTRGQHRGGSKDHRYTGEIVKPIDKHPKTGGRISEREVYDVLADDDDFSDLPPMFPEDDDE